jgi:proteasome accessory factor A
MQRRPIINTRDEPHANPGRFRRFHVIVGDANMSAFATRLKVGVTALVLEAIARAPDEGYPRLADPLNALVAISRDGKRRWEVGVEGGGMTTALEVQRRYLEVVRRYCDLEYDGREELVRDWEGVLTDLGEDYRRCRNRLDWVAKQLMIREFQEEQGLPDDDPWLRSLDLEYHRLDLHEGLYYGLEQAGAMAAVPPEDEVRKAVTQPPWTRAAIRGACVRRFASVIEAAQWDHVTLQSGGGPIRISLMDLFAPETIRHYRKAIEAAQSPEDLRTLV